MLSDFFDIFSKNPQISNFMKIRPVGAKLFRADRRTDMTSLIVAFRSFANALKNFSSLRVTQLQIYEHTHTHTRARARAHAHARTQTHKHARIQTRARARTRAHTSTHTR